MDSEYREPSWRGVLGTLLATVLVIAGLVLLASFFLQQGCPEGSAQTSGGACVTPSLPPVDN
jgi:hypothetical protein